MRTITPALAALLALGLALPGMAQETATEDAAQEADGVTELPLGEPVTEEEGIGTTYVAETHGDWEIRCITVPEGQLEPCQLYQLLLDENDNAVAEFNIFDVPDDGEVVAGATIVTPIDTLLIPQLRLSIDGGEARRFPFAFCQQIGCFVRLGLTSGDLDTFRRGATATVSIVPLPAPDQVVDLRVSLTGFTAGFAALSERMAALEEEAAPSE